MQKGRLREIYKQKLAELDGLEKLSIDELLFQNVTRFMKERFRANHIVGIYSPLKDEPKWKKRSFKQSLAYPYFVSAGVMEFALGENLEESSDFGVKISTPQKKLPCAPHVLIIPALAYDQSGFRLGRGGGYYDRYLSRFEGLSIGICYEDCLVDRLPREEHDQGVDIVITEKKILVLNIEE